MHSGIITETSTTKIYIKCLRTNNLKQINKEKKRKKYSIQRILTCLQIKRRDPRST